MDLETQEIDETNSQKADPPAQGTGPTRSNQKFSRETSHLSSMGLGHEGTVAGSRSTSEEAASYVFLSVFSLRSLLLHARAPRFS